MHGGFDISAAEFPQQKTTRVFGVNRAYFFFSVGELRDASKVSSANGPHLNVWDFDMAEKTRVFSAAEILLWIYQNPIHLNGTCWRTTFWRQREVRRRKKTARPNFMLDLIPAQQPIKNQHQILWCGYQHVITSRPITALVCMRRPAFFLLRCECSGTDKTQRKKTCVLGLNRPLGGPYGLFTAKTRVFFCCVNSAADISKSHTFKWGPLADEILDASRSSPTEKKDCCGQVTCLT